jgi:energy-converting hydrogenase Eha subunit C
MKYLKSVLTKAVLFPICLIMFIPAYLMFIIDPELNKFKFKMER